MSAEPDKGILRDILKILVHGGHLGAAGALGTIVFITLRVLLVSATCFFLLCEHRI